MHRALACAASCLYLIGFAPGAAAQAPAENTLQQVITDYERWQRRVDPIAAGQEGDREALRRLPNPTPQAEQAARQELTTFGERLAAIDARDLSAESAL